MNTITLPKTQHLVVFQEVIRSGSIGSAAKELGLTQPAVSKIINDVEAYFGIELVVRKNTGVTLTQAGQVMLSWSESITREMKNMVDEMKLHDLHVEPLFESDFILVASKSRTCTGITSLSALKNEQWVLPQTNMGYYSELLTTLQNNGISSENIVKTDSVVTIYNLVLNADFLTVIPCDMTTPFGSNQFITIPVEETLPVARYAAVWSKNYRIKKAASILVELAKEYSSYNCRRRRQLIEID